MTFVCLLVKEAMLFLPSCCNVSVYIRLRQVRLYHFPRGTRAKTPPGKKIDLIYRFQEEQFVFAFMQRRVHVPKGVYHSLSR